jgi:SAM-dependent methyltransferase
MEKMMKYQDYVIKDGKFVGEFDLMYKEFSDPWEQSKEIYATDNAIVINLIKRSHAKRIIELGCGLGHYTNLIAEQTGCTTLGVDISKTAILKAKLKYPNLDFIVGDILEKKIYDFKPNFIVMAEITWYVLNKLDAFLTFYKNNMPNTFLIHVLTTYPPGVQKYGTDKFSNSKQIMNYFNMNFLEWGEVVLPEGLTRNYFLGKW